MILWMCSYLKSLEKALCQTSPAKTGCFFWDSAVCEPSLLLSTSSSHSFDHFLVYTICPAEGSACDHRRQYNFIWCVLLSQYKGISEIVSFEDLRVPSQQGVCLPDDPRLHEPQWQPTRGLKLRSTKLRGSRRKAKRNTPYLRRVSHRAIPVWTVASPFQLGNASGASC